MSDGLDMNVKYLHVFPKDKDNPDLCPFREVRLKVVAPEGSQLMSPLAQETSFFARYDTGTCKMRACVKLPEGARESPRPPLSLLLTPE